MRKNYRYTISYVYAISSSMREFSKLCKEKEQGSIRDFISMYRMGGEL